MVASVPEFTSRIRSTGATRPMISDGQLGLGRRRRPERQATRCRLGDGVDDGRVGVAEDHRPPRADQVDVAVAVGVGQPAAVRLGDEARGAADRGEGSHRGVHPAGDDLAGVLEQLRRGAHARCRLVSATHADQCPSLLDPLNYRV